MKTSNRFYANWATFFKSATGCKAAMFALLPPFMGSLNRIKRSLLSAPKCFNAAGYHDHHTSMGVGMADNDDDDNDNNNDNDDDGVGW